MPASQKKMRGSWKNGLWKVDPEKGGFVDEKTPKCQGGDRDKICQWRSSSGVGLLWLSGECELEV